MSIPYDSRRETLSASKRSSVAGITASMHAALRWMEERGGDCAVARCNGGGRQFLAQGEVGPFMQSTARALVDAGLAEYVDQNGRKAVRFRLIGRPAA